MNWVHLDVDEVRIVTERAMLVVLDDGEELWLPLSQIADADDYNPGDRKCTISITEWLANERGLA